jgi:tellurite resistance protein TerC
MLALVSISWWHWAGFIAFVLLFLALDLGLFHRRPHAMKLREALVWSGVWFALAMLFAWGLQPLRGQKESLQFVTGYLIELSLSMDNVFVIALIFGYFHIPAHHQYRVLYWGVLGALIMRGLMIGLGLALITWLNWVLYLFGAFLLYSGIRMLFAQTQVDPEKNRVLQWVRAVYPVAPELDGQKFTTRWQGRHALTPLALVLVMIETTDLLFAVDSIPAVIAVTKKPFIVFTSNVFAILGLRSLYFVLAGAIAYFRYLKYGLSLVLAFIGVKMLLDAPDEGPQYWFQVDIPISVSLSVVASLLLLSIAASVIVANVERERGGRGATGP